MSILIKGMEKPKDSCWECKAQYNSVCSLKREHIKFDGVLDDCPLIEIPTPHGRLIDRDAVPEVSADPFEEEAFQGVLDDMPVILEAEGRL